MKVETWKCDECGKQRDKDTNHWYVICSDQRAQPPRITIKKFEPHNAGEPGEDICGQECLIRALNRHIVAV